jgi:hypothetical protein
MRIALDGPLSYRVELILSMMPRLEPSNAEGEKASATCRLCRSSIEDTPYVRGPSEDWFHAECLRSLLTLPDTPQQCRRCGALIGVNININVIAVNSCVTCGCPEPLESVTCEWCGMPLYRWQARTRLMHQTCYLGWCQRSPIFPKVVVETFLVLLVAFLAIGVALGFYAANSKVFLPLMPFLATILAGVPAALVWGVTAIRFWLRNRN